LPQRAQSDSTQRANALHLLNRLTYGPRPGDVDRVLAMGVDRFIEQQLNPDKIRDDAVERRLEHFEILRLDAEDLGRIYQDEVRARRQRQLAGANDSARAEPGEAPRRPRAGQPLPRARRLAGEFQQAAVVRATLSERQLYEVMVDFWTNHFNVFLGKGADRFLLPDYIEHTIRPNAMGKFEDLLIATAHSPAMLFYLDNVQSVVPGAVPPQLAEFERRAQRGQMPRFGFGRRPILFPPRRPDPARMDSLRQRIEQRIPKGINENYARELMELHTLGVDGGYTQQDVINVARIFTGWSMRPPRQGVGFVFNDWAHDRREKMALGHTFPAGHGEDEGVALLRMLANRPATMRHVSAKLCARFVADDPPDGCIDAGVHAWQQTGGDIREVLRAIFQSPEFWAPEYRGAKVKTPLEFVVSAVRAVGGEPDTTLALAQIVGRLGEPLYLDQPPTGYPETQDSWVNSGALLERLNVAMGIASGRAPGIAASLDELIQSDGDPVQLADRVNQVILEGTATPNTLRVLREQAGSLPPAQARIMAVGLALGSPEFQKQ
jgi:uncharacterized protein (DUF1800 family)